MCKDGLLGGLSLRWVKYQGGGVHGVHQEGTWTYILEDCRVFRYAKFQIGIDAMPPTALDQALDKSKDHVEEGVEVSDIEMAADQDEYLLIQRQGGLCSMRYPVRRKRQLVG